MKTSKFKSLIIVAAILIVSGSVTDTFAQRSGRGGGGGGGRSSGGSVSRGSFGGGSRSSVGGSARISQGGGSRSFQGGNSSAIQRGDNRVAQSNRGRAFSNGGRSFQGNSGRAFQGRGGRPYYSGRVGARYGRPGYGRPGYGFGGYRRSYYNYYRPYLGISLSVLPFGYYPFYFGADQFYYSGGLYYRQYDNEYKVVVPPVGAEVPTLPSEAQEVTINGQNYYEYKGVYYSETTNADGKTVYVIAGKDGVLNTPDGTINADNVPQVGDVVSALPDGSRQVMLKGEKYYVSEDGVYYEEVVDADNRITYRVVAN